MTMNCGASALDSGGISEPAASADTSAPAPAPPPAPVRAAVSTPLSALLPPTTVTRSRMASGTSQSHTSTPVRPTAAMHCATAANTSRCCAGGSGKLAILRSNPRDVHKHTHGCNQPTYQNRRLAGLASLLRAASTDGGGLYPVGNDSCLAHAVHIRGSDDSDAANTTPTRSQSSLRSPLASHGVVAQWHLGIQKCAECHARQTWTQLACPAEMFAAS